MGGAIWFIWMRWMWSLHHLVSSWDRYHRRGAGNRQRRCKL